MSKSLHLDKEGYSAEADSNAGISVNISVDVDSVVCVNSFVQGEDGRHVVTAGSDVTITADSDSNKVVIVIHPNNLTAKCVGGRGDTKSPGGP